MWTKMWLVLESGTSYPISRKAPMTMSRISAFSCTSQSMCSLSSNAVMAAMLMHDTLNPASSKNPANRAKNDIDNTLELFRTQAVHGGLWRSPYKVDSLGEVSALIYFGQLAVPYIAGLVCLGGVAAYSTQFFM